ncbi:MAG: DUF3320 domain-containing protein [Gemmobacter sp.]|nr:DUF3320 domain-containing protein [Gemmobacter sp.]
MRSARLPAVGRQLSSATPSNCRRATSLAAATMAPMMVRNLPSSRKTCFRRSLTRLRPRASPTHRLNWHYRSRDEALIAFSNHYYYDGELVTFPSPDASGGAVRLHKVMGIYQRAKGSTNPDEARAITAFIRKRLTEWLKRPEEDRPTLGVITFNAQQQGLILDLLDAERKANPDFEWFFSDDREEPLIVKNLENIQGDERDVMLFSITFGPDQAGKITMNFGAMNKDGGEKRLNVAVTRARVELHVFASITADQIDMTRTRARGVADLKAFLDFAGRGAVALAGQDTGSVGPADSPFEEAVRDALTAKGWEVHSQIGVSGFRIDLGVRHPDHAGAWLAGVECDGARYHSSATARDRDRIRQAVLEGLGWSILRIWSTDWFRAPEATLQRIDARLTEILQADRDRRAQIVTENQLTDAPEAMASEPEVMIEIDDAPLAPINLPVAPAPEAATLFAQGPAHGILGAPESRTGSAATPDAERFFDDSYTPQLLALMEQIIADEGPMPEALLARSVSQRHGWQRTGARIQARIAALQGIFDTAMEGDVRFLWIRGGVRDRVPFRGMTDRSLRDISRTEIADLIDRNAEKLATTEDPDIELARLAGIGRLSKDAREYLKSCREWRELSAAPL